MNPTLVSLTFAHFNFLPFSFTFSANKRSFTFFSYIPQRQYVTLFQPSKYAKSSKDSKPLQSSYIPLQRFFFFTSFSIEFKKQEIEKIQKIQKKPTTTTINFREDPRREKLTHSCDWSNFLSCFILKFSLRPSIFLAFYQKALSFLKIFSLFQTGPPVSTHI